MKRRDLVLKFVVGLLMAGVVFSGCGIFGGKTQSRELVLILNGTDMLNSCGEEVANTLPIRIFQLSGDSQISIASLQGLWWDPEKELGDEFVDQLEMILEPSQRIPMNLKPADGASIIAVVGNFCQTEGSCWKWVSPIDKISSPQALTFDKFCIREAR
ncbi:MAG: type VI secretion system lipoprotein TssJ [Candidatus Eisenbacteria bacterium]|uniref:Type VI secretion system lipoprotein TssJ n=1 Tax=Eiseniibacteriota bacterium TaxID=2212470 RepID=A0A948RWB5_UNCEI|nr:type VI secretion system lipoprotein TssJ [Candidatus Eisenbacteria bacterium]MBU1948763.1 type VI secretion system lipoprotein TssJ [Candidatus Eisenbacteria bacterium]MBU2692208.1 type VI secretion system lipoprotein TssJ [Candidatus Eisenbacteria bacterium]